MRDYPAYARIVAQMRARAVRPICVAVLLSTRWDCYAHVPKICIRPRDWARRRYTFEMLRELHVVAVAGEDCDNRHLAELLLELMHARPAALWVYTSEGQVLSDQNSPQQLSWWIRELHREAGLDYAARYALQAGISAAAREHVHQAETIARRSGLEASVRFQLAQWQSEDRVRELMRAPFLEGAA